jgi:hypothetical protein
MGRAVKILIENETLDAALITYAREIMVTVIRQEMQSLLDTYMNKLNTDEYIEKLGPAVRANYSNLMQAEILKYMRNNQAIKNEMKEAIHQRIDAADFGVNLLALINKKARELVESEYKGAMTELAEKQAEINATCVSAMKLLDEVKALKSGQDCSCKAKVKTRKGINALDV